MSKQATSGSIGSYCSQAGIFGIENTVREFTVCSFGQFSCEALPKTVTVHTPVNYNINKSQITNLFVISYLAFSTYLYVRLHHKFIQPKNYSLLQAFIVLNGYLLVTVQVSLHIYCDAKLVL